MQDTHFNTILIQQRAFFASGATLPIAFRIKQLKTLKLLLQTHESAITDALQKDLHKAPMESMITEVWLLIDEINFAIKNLKKWARPEKVATPFLLWPGRSEIRFEPYGSVLIIGPWNYPLMLVLSPLIGAISAGNCAIVKPSEIATHTEEIIVNLINQYFPSDYIAAIKADPQQIEQLLQEKVDYLFFTGSTSVGKIMMTAAAKHLTPITLELGGKSPCIVDETADLDFAARRIIWGKMMNAGQTCIAPDYLYVHHSCKDTLIHKMKEVINTFYGTDPSKSDSYGRIINQKHFDRLSTLMQAGNLLVGGEMDKANLYIAPTLIDTLSWHDPIMQEEIFGPVLPIFSYDKLDDLIGIIKEHPKSLSLYLFTCDKQTEEKIIDHISFGGGCVNDCILQVANYHLPFGGVGPSGMGQYHGKYSFELFSHRKGIYKKRWLVDVDLQYPPYSRWKGWWLRLLAKK